MKKFFYSIPVFLQMIKKFIYKTNIWYENLNNIKGGIFYLSLIFIPYSILFLTLSKPYYLIFPLLWVFIVGLWRMSYSMLKEWENIKNNRGY